MGILRKLKIGHKQRKKRKGPVKQRFFGIQNLTFHGGVYAPDSPDVHFHIALLDAEGRVLFSSKADKKSNKDEIPNGHGFTLPVPYEWLNAGETPVFFQFKILETDEVFPKIPREIPVTKLLKNQGKNKQVISPLPSHIVHLTQLVEAINGDKILVVGTHSMDRTGAPMIILEILKLLKERHHYKIILICLGPRANLFSEFDRHCEVIIENLEDAFKIAKKESAGLFLALKGKARPGVALINSLCSASLAKACHKVGLDVYSLIHEYPHAFDPDWINEYFEAASGVVFPCLDVKQSFESHEKLHLHEHSGTSFSILPQGCYQLEKQPLTQDEIDGFSRKFLDENHLSRSDKVIMSCGTIDSRKGFDWFISLIRAFAKAVPYEQFPHFLWVGKVNEWEVFHHGLHDLRLEGLIGHFHHLDEIDDVRLPMQLAGVFLLCSRVDPFPSVVLEAFLAGVPVIGFDRGQGSRDMIRETGFGTVIPYLDIGASIEAIGHLLSKNSWKRKRVNQLGRSFVQDRFLYADYVDSLVSWIGGSPLAQEKSQRENFYLANKSGTFPPVMLMGFHRSGTSWLSEALHSMGINMNPSGKFLSGSKGNLHGHFEDLHILDHHCGLMYAQHQEFMDRWGGKRCIFLPDYEHDWQEDQGETGALCHHLSQTSPWGWKDPRTLLFFDLWNSIFAKPVKLLALRHPLEIFISLIRRNTDPYFCANPLSFFDAYEAYHQQALADFEQHPDQWCIVPMPCDTSKLEALHDFLTIQLDSELAPLAKLEAFDHSRFHQLHLPAEIENQFAQFFPKTAAIYQKFSGIDSMNPPSLISSPELQEKWLADVLSVIIPDEAQMLRRMQLPFEGETEGKTLRSPDEIPLATAPTEWKEEGAPPATIQRLESMLDKTVPGEPGSYLATGRGDSLKDQFRLVKPEFAGAPLLCWHCARLVIAIRRGVNTQKHWASLRHLLGTPRYRDLLLEHLNTRWLIAICDTYADHGNQIEQMAAVNLSMLVNLIKLADTERLLLLNASYVDQPLEHFKTNFPHHLWDGVTSFLIDSGDMPRNMILRFSKSIANSPPLNEIANTILERIRKDPDNLLTRLAAFNPRFWQ